MKPEIKKDCFAYYSQGMDGKPIKTPTCSGLEEMLCARGECPFYKPKREYLKRLIDIHGTTDMRKIKEAYAIRKGAGLNA